MRKIIIHLMVKFHTLISIASADLFMDLLILLAPPLVSFSWARLSSSRDSNCRISCLQSLLQANVAINVFAASNLNNILHFFGHSVGSIFF